MVTARLTAVEHAKQLVSHGAHAADIEVVEGLLAELEKSKKAIENLREYSRKQFELVDSSEEGFQFEYLESFNPPPFEVAGKEGTFEVVGSRDYFGRVLVYTFPKCHARPLLEQYEEVVPALQKLSQESNQ